MCLLPVSFPAGDRTSDGLQETSADHKGRVRWRNRDAAEEAGRGQGGSEDSGGLHVTLRVTDELPETSRPTQGEVLFYQFSIIENDVWGIQS